MSGCLMPLASAGSCDSDSLAWEGLPDSVGDTCRIAALSGVNSCTGNERPHVRTAAKSCWCCSHAGPHAFQEATREQPSEARM